VARKKTSVTRVSVKTLLSGRLKEVRQELFGDHGGPELARRIGLPARTWYNYETGVTVPAEVLLGFIEETGVSTLWLLTGEGPKYQTPGYGVDLGKLSGTELIRHGLSMLEHQSLFNGNLRGGERAEANGATNLPADYAPIPLLSMEELAGGPRTDSKAGESVMMPRGWLPNPAKTVAATLADDSMAPMLPEGSVVAIDRSITNAQALEGKIVAALIDGEVLIRWLDLGGRHFILRPNMPGAGYPMIPIDIGSLGRESILGHVVFAWSRFRD